MAIAAALKQVIESTKPELVLFPHTYQVRDFAPKLAARLGKGMVGDCVGFRNEGWKTDFRAPDVSGEDCGGRYVYRCSVRGLLHFSPVHFARIC